MDGHFCPSALKFGIFILGLVSAVLLSEPASAATGTLDATQFPGTDPCAKVNAALAALPPEGGTIDATGFTAAQLAATPCLGSINARDRAKIMVGSGTWYLYGNPGIKILGGKVTIECPQSSEGDLYKTYPPNFQSGGPYPLISDTIQSSHGTDGFTIRNCYLEGNNIGTFGLFFPYGNAGQLYKIFTSGFTSVGQFTIGGQWTAQSAYSGMNGGDGVVWGYDGSVWGNAQYAGNGGSGLHVVVGGSTLQNLGTYHNRLHGFYIDGTGDPNWTPLTIYIQQHFIRPFQGNPGNFAYFTQTPGTTSASAPQFCQTPGCTVNDGSVIWINVGTALGYGNESVFNDSIWTTLDIITCTDTGYKEPEGFVADNIRVEGTIANPVKFTMISNANCHQSENGDYYANGIHLLNVNYVNLTGIAWLGSGYSNVAGGSGLLLERAKGVVLVSMASWFSYSSAIKIVNSNNSTLTGIVAVNTGVASTPKSDTYAVRIDADSVAITLDDLTVRDDRIPPISCGIEDEGSKTVVGDYRGMNLVEDPPAGGQHRAVAGLPVNTRQDAIQNHSSYGTGSAIAIDAFPATNSRAEQPANDASSDGKSAAYNAPVSDSPAQQTSDDSSQGGCNNPPVARGSRSWYACEALQKMILSRAKKNAVRRSSEKEPTDETVGTFGLSQVRSQPSATGGPQSGGTVNRSSRKRSARSSRRATASERRDAKARDKLNHPRL